MIQCDIIAGPCCCCWLPAPFKDRQKAGNLKPKLKAMAYGLLRSVQLMQLECIILAGAALRWHVQEMQTGFAHGRAELVTGDSFRASAALHAESLETSGETYCITCTVKPRHVHQLGSSLSRLDPRA